MHNKKFKKEIKAYRSIFKTFKPVVKKMQISMIGFFFVKGAFLKSSRLSLLYNFGLLIVIIGYR